MLFEVFVSGFRAICLEDIHFAHSYKYYTYTHTNICYYLLQLNVFCLLAVYDVYTLYTILYIFFVDYVQYVYEYHIYLNIIASHLLKRSTTKSVWSFFRALFQYVFSHNPNKVIYKYPNPTIHMFFFFIELKRFRSNASNDTIINTLIVLPEHLYSRLLFTLEYFVYFGIWCANISLYAWFHLIVSCLYILFSSTHSIYSL